MDRLGNGRIQRSGITGDTSSELGNSGPAVMVLALIASRLEVDEKYP